jgi:hypothetical protein
MEKVEEVIEEINPLKVGACCNKQGPFSASFSNTSTTWSSVSTRRVP